ncbi:MAG TPA: AsmA-like C-terminal region-containing protein, partial [Gammaproteobacteria bacterium]|nr:AsmA-like C-terminal region-containing protein [Gammaproteobacteria bacterium]
MSNDFTPFFLNCELTSNHQTLAHIFFNTEWILKKEKEQLNLQKITLKFQLPDGITNLITGDTLIEGFSQKPIIKANLLGNALQFGTVKIAQIKTMMTAQENIVTFAPIDIHIAKSQQNATLKLDMRGDTPKIYITHEAHDFEINDLLTLFNKKDKLSGKTRITMNLSATGTDLQALQNSLSGKAAIEINSGKFHGIDLMNLLKSTQSSIHSLIDALTHKLSIDSLSVIKSELAKWKTESNSSAFTPFNSLKATATITNGVIQNPDLAINQTDYAINGAGTINPQANNIQYQTTLQLKNNPYPANDKAGTFLFQTPLHIQIQGTLDDPKVKPELSRYTNSALEFAQKELVKKVIDKTVEKTLDKIKGNSAVQDTLQKALG